MQAITGESVPQTDEFLRTLRSIRQNKSAYRPWNRFPGCFTNENWNSNMPDRIHIFPVKNLPFGGFHTNQCTDDTGMCWCKPEHKQVCSEANEYGFCDPNCWRCQGEALVPIYTHEYSILIIHNNKGRACYPSMPDSQLGAL